MSCNGIVDWIRISFHYPRLLHDSNSFPIVTFKHSEKLLSVSLSHLSRYDNEKLDKKTYAGKDNVGKLLFVRSIERNSMK